MKRSVEMKVFKRFLLYLLINSVSSTVPWLHIGLIMGFPAILLSSIVMTLLYAKDIGARK